MGLDGGQVKRTDRITFIICIICKQTKKKINLSFHECQSINCLASICVGNRTNVEAWSTNSTVGATLLYQAQSQ